jgi:uncharacterized protein YigE (DUF2233 family)
MHIGLKEIGKLVFASSSILAIFTQSAGAEACETRKLGGLGHIVCTIDPKKSDLQLFWKDDKGKPYRTFSALAAALSGTDLKLAFAMNAGMYSRAFSPIGLYVEKGRELSPANTAEISGPAGQVPNFYKKPNGVFFLGQNGAGIVTTEEFLAGATSKPRFATQSGPMLVIQNKLHPALIQGAKDRRRRSGVGVCEGGVVRLAISEDDVNFYDFAILFRDELKCPNALFLDGGRGAGLYAPSMRRNDWSGHGGYGPMIGLIEKASGD